MTITPTNIFAYCDSGQSLSRMKDDELHKVRYNGLSREFACVSCLYCGIISWFIYEEVSEYAKSFHLGGFCRRIWTDRFYRLFRVAGGHALGRRRQDRDVPKALGFWMRFVWRRLTGCAGWIPQFA